MPVLKAHQLQVVSAAADKLPAEKRSVFLDRVAARLRALGFRFSDADLDEAMRHALKGLVQNSAA